MFTKIGTISVSVSDQDKALDFYVNTLGFEKIDDQPMSETERWLELASPGAQTHIMLGLRGQSGGDKTGFTGYVLHTDNIEATCETLKARGVTLSQELNTEPGNGRSSPTQMATNSASGHLPGNFPSTSASQAKEVLRISIESNNPALELELAMPCPLLVQQQRLNV